MVRHLAYRLFDGANLIGTQSLAVGQTVFTISTLSVGSHTIRADYQGDGVSFQASTASLTQVVNPLP